MTTARITAVMLDGTKHETVGVYMALSDRVAFERQFNLSVMALRAASRELVVGPNGTAESATNVLREEQTAFFIWRTLTRGDCPVGSFDEFLEGCEDITLERLEGAADPTAPGLLPGT